MASKILTSRKIETAKPGEKVITLNDGDGLIFEVRPNGGRSWIFRGRVAGKARRFGLGPYPAVGLAEARERADEMRRKIRAGVDPVAEKRKAATEGATFEAVARDWWSNQRPAWSASHAERVMGRLRVGVFPRIGAKPIASLTAADIRAMLDALESMGKRETASRALQMTRAVFDFAEEKGLVTANPAAGRKVLLPKIVEHHAAITDPEEFGGLLRAIDSYNGGYVGLALRALPLVVVRPGEIRHAEWSELDFKAANWEIPAAKMKQREPLIVPLPRQALAIFKQAKAIATSERWVFPGLRGDRPFSDAALTAALRILGYPADKHQPHGFRASFRTIGAEILGFPAELLEQQLAHAVKDPLGRAYNRTKFLPERRKLLQAWADYLEELKAAKG